MAILRKRNRKNVRQEDLVMILQFNTPKDEKRGHHFNLYLLKLLVIAELSIFEMLHTSGILKPQPHLYLSMHTQHH